MTGLPEGCADVADVDVIPRRDFNEEFGKGYQAGQHLTALGPSGRGKTRQVGQLIVAVRRYHPDIKFTILHGKIKGRDNTIEQLSRAAKLPITHTAKLSRYQRLRYRDRGGHIVRPLEKPGDSITEENAVLSREFGKAIHKNYHTSHKRPMVTVVDEAHQAHTDLKLKTQAEGPLMRGRPDNAMWSLVQRGRYVSYMVYDQAEYLLIYYDPDVDNQKRYAEIGGVDPLYIRDLASELKTRTVADGSTISQALFFRRSGSYLAIVDT